MPSTHEIMADKDPQLLTTARQAVSALLPGREVAAFTPLGGGHINETLLVTFTSGEPRRAVLQRLNRAVFPEPEKLMGNLAVLAEHFATRLESTPLPGSERWAVVHPLGGVAGQRCWGDGSGAAWRLISYVENAEGRLSLAAPGSAREAGRGLGIFHRLTANLDSTRLADTLPGFHVTPGYLAAYDRLPGAGGAGQPEEEYCRAVIEAHRQLAPVLEAAAACGVIRPRVIHGDPRLANLLFDRRSGRAVALVDLDTVKPGLLHYDLGDCLRSGCNPEGDDPENPTAIRFDLAICRELLAGYLAEAGATLSAADFSLIYPAVRLLALELGLRFFSDHLAGDHYFRVRRPGHNLARALGQFRLLAAIEAQEGEIRRIVAEFQAADGKI